MRKKLTALAIPSLAEGNYADQGCPSLNLRVGKTRRTWSCFHRIRGRLIQTTLGHFPTMTLAQARKAVGSLAERVEAGRPPELPPPHPRGSVVTLGDLIDKYEKHRRQKGGRTKTLDVGLRVIRRGLADHLNMPADKFSKADLREIRDRIAITRPVAANRFQSRLSPMLKWAEAEDLVAYDVGRGVLKVGAETSRDRVLNRAEIKAAWHASFALGEDLRSQNAGRLIRTLICTGQRRGEVAGMRHGDVLGGIWKQTAESNKPGREHRLKLPPIAVEQLGEGEARDLVFPGVAVTSGSFSRLKVRLDSISGVTGWTIHDVRRSVATQMQELGISNDVVQSVLNHAVAGVAGTYLRSQLEAAKSDALARWCAELERIVGQRRVVS